MAAEVPLAFKNGANASFVAKATDFGITCEQDEFHYWVESMENGTLLLRAENVRMFFQGSQDAIALIWEWLVDVLVSKVLVCSQNGLMLLRSAGQEGVVLAQVRGRNEYEWDVIVSRHIRLQDMPYAFALAEDGSEQINSIHLSFAGYCSWAGWNPKDRVSTTQKRRLLIKVDPAESWFMKFPFAMFCRLELGRFAEYDAVQSIVTDRTISKVTMMSDAIETEMADMRHFLAGSYIIVNSYEEHLKRFPGLREATELLIEVMHGFREFRIRSERYNLRWVVNPSQALLHSILRSRETRFVFANFEADEGIWKLGDGKHSRWDDAPKGEAQGTISTLQPEFPLEDLEQKLSHIMLLRVFHCNSIYNPYASNDPASEGTLAGKLLRTGAWFVEGSFTKEPYLGYVCMLLQLLLGRSDLQVVLKMKMRSQQFQLETMMSRTNALLNAHGFRPIS